MNGSTSRLEWMGWLHRSFVAFAVFDRGGDLSDGAWENVQRVHMYQDNGQLHGDRLVLDRSLMYCCCDIEKVPNFEVLATSDRGVASG